MMKELLPIITDVYAPNFLKLKEEGKDPYVITKGVVAIALLSGLYEKFINEGVVPLEQLPKEKKLLFWEKAKEFHEDHNERIKASKACYVLELLTEK